MKRLLTAALLAVLGAIPVAGQAAESGAPFLLSPPYVANPTTDTAIISILNGDQPFKGELRYRAEGESVWRKEPLDIAATTNEAMRAGTRNVTLTSLKPSTRYEYEVWQNKAAKAETAGSFMTQRGKGESFRFVAMTDAHVNPTNPERSPVLRATADTAATFNPDFVLHLGDNMQTVGSTHGGPAAQEEHPSIFYIYWRQVLGKLQSSGGQFFLNGNWEGENGWHPEPNRSWARNARMLFAPSPDDKTYPEGGSKNQDYYAFTWGDALFINLNATGYNDINHEHTRGPGGSADWTLGQAQFAWLEKTLAASKAKWKFISIHHAVGGNAGDEVNSNYGRGGGRAANVGEQAKVHALMRKYGVQAFLYGHDHVFTDMEVDGIHYICTGSAGAPWKFSTAETGYEAYVPDSGFTVVDIDKDAAKVRYISHDAKELYTVTLKP